MLMIQCLMSHSPGVVSTLLGHVLQTAADETASTIDFAT